MIDKVISLTIAPNVERQLTKSLNVKLIAIAISEAA